jgi:hypothetical protein
MKTLILVDAATHTLSLFADALASSFPFPASVQVMPVCDVSVTEWNWAECVMVGFSYPGVQQTLALETFLVTLPAGRVKGKGLAIFQVQSRQDPPISAAYGFALARDLRARGMALVAPPTVFFRTGGDRVEMEGELLRSTLWVGSLVKHWISLLPKETK